jgi:hypothetical protein
VHDASTDEDRLPPPAGGAVKESPQTLGVGSRRRSCRSPHFYAGAASNLAITNLDPC